MTARSRPCALWTLTLFVASVTACAAGQGGPGGGSGAGTGVSVGGAGGTTSSTASTPANGGGGAGGETSSTSSTSEAGGGGATSSTSAAGGSGGSGGTTTTESSASGGSGGGGAGPTGKVVLLAANGSDLLVASFDESTGWTAGEVASGASAGPAVALASAGEGVGLYRSAMGTQLQFTKWNGLGFGAPLGVGMQAQSGQSTPSMVFGGGVFSVGYWGSDNKHYYARYAGAMGGWSPVAEPVQPPGGGQSFGSSPPSVAALGADVFLAHAGTDGAVYEQRRTGGMWETAAGHDVGGVKTNVPVTIVSLTGGQDDLMIVYVLNANNQIGWMTRKAGNPPTWSAAKGIPDALTQDRVAVTALPNGGAALAFRGLNTGVYTCTYQPAAGQWTAPEPLANPNHDTSFPPAVAPGIGTAQAELAFVEDGTGAILHSRLAGGDWTAPITVSPGPYQFVGMASAPP